ncbi:MAG: thioredoxin family protein [Bacteroidales bacterium]|nr:thioredoxin family protein [Bacteroidales bacterium]
MAIKQIINMMKSSSFNIVTIAVVSIIFSGCGYAQDVKKIYDPTLDGMKQIQTAISTAKTSGKHVLVQYGGNWCPWCIKFDAFSKADTAISKVIADNYIPVKLNYSPENKNDAANLFLGNPTRFGFPVFIIIDGKGKVLHIQDSALLEEGQGYSQKKVIGFLSNWTASAIVPPVRKDETKK